ncbi:MAG: NADP-dependent phosphogluconate dehydrogenase [Bacteroidota bacterium]
MKQEKYHFGMVGLGVMGRNFILNVADNGFSAAGHDLDSEKVAALNSEGAGKKVKGTTEKTAFINMLEVPRKIMLLVPAGKVVDIVINDLLPHLEEGDLIIDGGNSFYEDTNRREKLLTEKGFHFMGIGVSGGAKGARLGPSIMPGGDKAAYELIKPVLEAVSAKVNNEPCVAYLGTSSAGNYVKMIHNGIEYGLMQLIAEAYDLLKQIGGLSNEELHQTFTKWNEGKLKSFLIEITAAIFSKEDNETGRHLVDAILDKAKQKGTGKWTSQNAMDLGMPVPTIDAAVTMREISALKSDRITLDSIYDGVGMFPEVDKAEFIQKVEHALYFAFIITYAQGMAVLKTASEEYSYGLNLEIIAKIWRGGCIIRAGLLENIRQAYDKNTDLINLISDSFIVAEIKAVQQDTREVIGLGIQAGIPTATLSAALTYFDALRAGRLPLNLVQAQRDFFGSHTYERTDMEGIFHTEWE